MKFYFIVLTLVVASLISAKAYSWGPEGHQIVALIAQQILKDQSQKNDPSASKTLDAINTILGQTQIKDAATWPDVVKELSRACSKPPFVKDPNFVKGKFKGESSAICDAYQNTANWHFTTVNADLNEYEYKFPSKISQGAELSPYAIGDLVIIIKGLSQILRKENAPVLDGVTSFTKWTEQCPNGPDHNCKKEALKFLIHFLGDIHQPLHSGAHCDIGGNSQLITFFGEVPDPMATWCGNKGAPCTTHELHQAWDTTLLVKNVFDATKHPPVPLSFSATYAAKLLRDMANVQESSQTCMKVPPSLPLTSENIGEDSGPNNGPISWVNESVCYFPQVYNFLDDAKNQVVAKKKTSTTKRSVAQALAQTLPPIPNLCNQTKKQGEGRNQIFTEFDVGQKYYDANMPTINERLYWGGARLANVLKYIYGDGDKWQGDPNSVLQGK